MFQRSILMSLTSIFKVTLSEFLCPSLALNRSVSKYFDSMQYGGVWLRAAVLDFLIVSNFESIADGIDKIGLLSSVSDVE